MARWKVEISDLAEAELIRLLKKKIIAPADIKILLRWVYEMEEFGPGHITQSNEWHDHELDRDWLGYRSSAFSSSGRIIYKIIEDLIVVQVARITTDHNYKK